MKKIKIVVIPAILWLLPILLTLVIIAESHSRTQMPPFALESVLDGKVVESKSFEDKVLLVSFFATWCPPCKEEASVFIRLQNELSEAGFSVVALSVDQGGASEVASFVKKHEINYPVLLAERKTAMDFGGIYGIPVAFLVNKSGNVVKKYEGYVRYNDLSRDIKSLLN